MLQEGEWIQGTTYLKADEETLEQRQEDQALEQQEIDNAVPLDRGRGRREGQIVRGRLWRLEQA